MARLSFVQFCTVSLLSVSVTFLASCGDPRSSRDTVSEVAGTGSQLFRSLDEFPNVPRLKSEATLFEKIPLFFASQKKMTAASSTAHKKSAFRSVLLSILAQEKGIHPDQLHRVVSEVVGASRGEHCGGVSCSRVFGFDETQVNQELDQIAETVNKDPRLKAESLRDLRRDLTGSFQTFDRQSYFSRLKAMFSRDQLGGRALEGTCIPTPFQAFGMRGNEAIKGLGQMLATLTGKIDLRKSGPQKFQGVTGSCHMHALLELIDHSRYGDLKATRDIDRERLFMEIWSKNLGENVDQAVQMEIFSLEKISQARARFMSQEMRSRDLNTRQAFDKFINVNRIGLRFSGQGGYGDADFMYLRQFGAVTKSAGLPPLSLEEIEGMGEELAIARLRVLERETFGPFDITPQKKAEILRPALERIFAKVNEWSEAPRGQVKEELYSYRYIREEIDTEAPEKTARQLQRLLASKGPVYVESDFHATALVGYDPWSTTFLIRDTDDPLRRPYVAHTAQEFFQYARYLGVLIRK